MALKPILSEQLFLSSNSLLLYDDGLLTTLLTPKILLQGFINSLCSSTDTGKNPMMHPELRNLLYTAEIDYFQTPDINKLREISSSLKIRVKTYKVLREREVDIFQPVANKLLSAFSNESPELLEHALKHWLSALRYCAMGMLLNDPIFLNHRLLEWLLDIVQAYELEAIEACAVEALENSLKQTLQPDQLELIQPFLEQAATTLVRKTQPPAIKL